jgi:protein SERAC1
MLNSHSIVFVHGLTGNRENTWAHPNGVLWPRDLLPEDLPSARIMTFGYDADVVGLIKTAGSNTLRDHGKSLATDVAMLRARSGSENRPLIFVAHSLGGLVVEQVR